MAVGGYHFLWQNPFLRSVAYPTREEKLRLFLSTYKEVEVVKASKAKPAADQKAFIEAEVAKYDASLAALDHDGLVKAVLAFFDAHKEYPDWMRYIVIHISGMRYHTAHSSWADPRPLLVKYEKMLMDVEEKKLKSTNPAGIPAMKAARQAKMAEYNDPVRTPDEKVYEILGGLNSNGTGVLPGWAWAMLISKNHFRMKYVDSLNLPTWEALTSAQQQERIKADPNLRQLMFDWLNPQQGDPTLMKVHMTAWREVHYDTLDLVVTQLVCNEVSEHTHHLRGFLKSQTGGGLTGRPDMYYKTMLAARPKPTAPVKPLKPPKDVPKPKPGQPAANTTPAITTEQATPPEGPYLSPPYSGDYYKRGASILWLGWQGQPVPTAWQIAIQVGTWDFKRGDTRFQWTYKPESFSGKMGFVRTREDTTPPPIDPKTKKPVKKPKTFIKEYLRWTHEAIVLDTVELRDGWYVLTFETQDPSSNTGAKTGLNKRGFGSLVPWQNKVPWNVFVGYLPDRELEPARKQKLAAMLDSTRILAKPAPPVSVVEPQAAVAFGFGFDEMLEPVEVDQRWAKLTKRQKQVAAMTCQGLPARQIASLLDSSPSNIYQRLVEARQKMGADDTRELKQILQGYNFGEYAADLDSTG